MCADPRVVELAAAWWRKAKDDLAVAERIVDLPFACCFHCQQAAEKAIKALLVLHQQDFGRLHDLGQLLSLVDSCRDTPPGAAAAGLEALTRYAVESRYPPGDASPEEAQAALAKARLFLDWAATRLPETATGDDN